MLENLDFKKLLESIENSRYILIATKENSSLCSLATALALSNYFSENKIKHKIFNASKNPAKNLDFINNFSKISKELPKFYDLILSIDCNNFFSFGFESEILENIPIIDINKSKSNNNLDIIPPIYNSELFTAELIYDFFKFHNIKISKNMAISLYSAFYLGSNSFSKLDEDLIFEKVDFLIKSGATPALIAKKLLKRDSLAKYRILPKILDTLELHKEGEIATIYALPSWFEQSGATFLDTDDVMDMVLNISIVKIVFFFREKGNINQMKYELKDDTQVDMLNSILKKMNEEDLFVEYSMLELKEKMILKGIL